MGVANIIKILKQIHPEDILLVKVGTFYHAYGRDAYIISYLLGYQIKKIEFNLNDCGFPKSALNKVLVELENKKISYLLVNKSLNYEVEEEANFKSENQYKEIYHKAHKYIAKKNRIDAIHNYLIDNMEDMSIKEKISKIEEILYEI